MASTSRCCVNDPDKFCYVCGQYVLKDQRKSITKSVSGLYFAYFGIEIRQQDKVWVPHSVCKVCVEHLRQWKKGTRKSLKFGVPMIWREQKNHYDDCYFCMTNIVGINRNNRHTWKYPNISSAQRPIPHSENVPIPAFYQEPQQSQEDEVEMPISSQIDDDFEYCEKTSNPKQFSKNELNDLIRDLDLS